MTTSRVLRDLEVRAVGLVDEAEAVAADDRAVLQDHAMAEHARARESTTCEWMTQSSPMRTPGADDDVRIDDRSARRLTRPAPMVTNGPIDTSAPIVASAATDAQAVDASGGRRACARSRPTACANARYG